MGATSQRKRENEIANEKQQNEKPGNVAARADVEKLFAATESAFGQLDILPEEAREARRIDAHRVVPKPTRGFDLIRIVDENLPCGAVA